MIDVILKFLRENFFWIFVFFLFSIDCVYTYHQYSFDYIDGDLARIIAPSEHYGHVFDDPLGYTVIKEGAIYPATNRYFNHAFDYYYFRLAPSFFQNFTNSVESAFLSVHVLKFITFLLLNLALFLYSRLFSLKQKRSKAICLLTIFPFFLVGYNFDYVALLDYCISYTVAYAFFFSILLLYLYPIVSIVYRKQKSFNTIYFIFWLFLAVVLALSGPLVAPCFLIVCLFYFLDRLLLKEGLKKIENVFKEKLTYLILFIGVVSIYSLYLGTYNYESGTSEIGVLERYNRALEGYYEYFFSDKGVRTILLFLMVNLSILFFLFKNRSSELKVVLLFAFGLLVTYLLLLPLGGFRPYRPLIIRRDTAVPVLCGLIFIFSYSSHYIYSYFKTNYRVLYACLISIIATYFIYIDDLPSHNNICQKDAFYQLSETKDTCVYLPNDCGVLSWSLMNSCENSKIQSKVLQLWKVTDRRVFFYQKPHENE